MFTEVSAVQGTIWAIVIIGFSAFLTVLLFTASVRMSACVVTNITAILSCVLAFFYLAGHKLGIVEAVSITVLLGSSVDYSLHIADAYTECCIAAGEQTETTGVAAESERGTGFNTAVARATPQVQSETLQPVGMQLPAGGAGWQKKRRQALAHEAVLRIGGPVWHAAITTFLSVICLVGASIVIFAEFGRVIAASVFSSITFALLLLPSLLAQCGPVDLRRTNRCRRHVLAAMWACGLMGGALLLLWLYDLGCEGCVQGPDGTPLFGSLGAS